MSDSVQSIVARVAADEGFRRRFAASPARVLGRLPRGSAERRVLEGWARDLSRDGGLGHAPADDSRFWI